METDAANTYYLVWRLNQTFPFRPKQSLGSKPKVEKNLESLLTGESGNASWEL